MLRQLIGDQRTRDAAAKHRHIAAMVGRQARERLHQSVADRPV